MSDSNGEVAGDDIEVDPAPEPPRPRKRRREEEEQKLYTDMIAQLVHVKPIDKGLLEDGNGAGDGSRPRKRFKRGAYAEPAIPRPVGEVEAYLDNGEEWGIQPIGKRKPTAYGMAEWGDKGGVKHMAAHLTDWAQTKLTPDQLSGSEFEALPNTLDHLRKLKESSSGRTEAKNVPAGGNQGPHTIAHVMTFNALATSLPSIYTERESYEANPDLLVAGQLFSKPGDDGAAKVKVPVARKVWAEVELVWRNMDLPRSIGRIIARETADIGTLDPARQKIVKSAAEKTLVAYTEWFNRIEEALNVGMERAREALEEAGDDEEEQKAAGEAAAKEGEAVVNMIHHLWTAHPYATYCWQDGEKASAEETGGKGESEEKFLRAHAGFVNAKAAFDAASDEDLSDADMEEDDDDDGETEEAGSQGGGEKEGGGDQEDEDADEPEGGGLEAAREEFAKAQRTLADTVGDMIDPYAADHVKDPEGFDEYLIQFCGMIDDEEPEELAALVDRRTEVIRRTHAYVGRLVKEDAFKRFLAGLQTENDTTKLDPAEITKQFPDIADEEQFELFAKRLRSLIRARNKARKS